MSKIVDLAQRRLKRKLLSDDTRRLRRLIAALKEAGDRAHHVARRAEAQGATEGARYERELADDLFAIASMLEEELVGR